MALRYFATGSLFSIVGDSQHVSKAVVSRCVKDVAHYFYKHATEYIHWPKSFGEKLMNAKKFYKHQDQHTPNVIGIVDGTHVPILTPKINESCYVNRKSYHSINATVNKIIYHSTT